MKLIDADKLKQILWDKYCDEICGYHDLTDKAIQCNEALTILSTLDTVDAIPVEWINNKYPLKPRHITIEEMLEDWSKE